jgi:hypothetical protein
MRHVFVAEVIDNKRKWQSDYVDSNNENSLKTQMLLLKSKTYMFKDPPNGCQREYEEQEKGGSNIDAMEFKKLIREQPCGNH